ncbi:MAG: SufS family cysteine desulfurase [Colwelliaceae bacterium]|nr:SufS family cysteine desulfurase [Colwelliaceae bacterium]
MSAFDLKKFRSLFPLLEQKVFGKEIVYFDNGATTQKPDCVINKEKEYYEKYNANVHRAAHQLSANATSAFEASRITVQKFIHAKFSHEVIWTKGTTESINLVAQSWGGDNLLAGDEIVLSRTEHHANIVPWQIMAERTGAVIKILQLDESGRIDGKLLDSIITDKTKIVCCTHISNVIGKINPIERIIKRAKLVGAKTLIDGAQAISHVPVDVQQLDCDFYVFSAHKMYGPTGVGVLYGKTELLEQMPVYQTGGEMIKKVSFSGTTFNKLPFKFEAGTPNIAGIIAFSSAIEFINEYKINQKFDHKNQLTDYCYEQLASLKEIQFVVQGKPDIPLFSFLLNKHHHQDVSSSLDVSGIAVRVGHHCAMPLMEYLNISGCIRISLAPYNTFEEVDYFINTLKHILQNKDKQLSSSIDTKSYDSLVTSEEILSTFSKAKSWDAKHREIMLLGKTLKRMPKDLRSNETLILGCESAAWLSISKSPEGIFSFEADSDAKIIRGLLVIVLAALNNQTAEKITQINIDEYFLKLGLIQHLSPSRGNGLLAIVNKIRHSVL